MTGSGARSGVGYSLASASPARPETFTTCWNVWVSGPEMSILPRLFFGCVMLALAPTAKSEAAASASSRQAKSGCPSSSDFLISIISKGYFMIR